MKAADAGTATVTPPAARQVRDVPVRECVPRAENRKVGDQAENVDELAASMAL